MDSQSEDYLQGLYNCALQLLEENEALKSEGLLGLQAVKDIIMERNLESLPFYQYMKVKFNRDGSVKKSKAGGGGGKSQSPNGSMIGFGDNLRRVSANFNNCASNISNIKLFKLQS